MGVRGEGTGTEERDRPGADDAERDEEREEERSRREARGNRSQWGGRRRAGAAGRGGEAERAQHQPAGAPPARCRRREVSP